MLNAFRSVFWYALKTSRNTFQVPAVMTPWVYKLCHLEWIGVEVFLLFFSFFTTDPVIMHSFSGHCTLLFFSFNSQKRQNWYQRTSGLFQAEDVARIIVQDSLVSSSEHPWLSFPFFPLSLLLFFFLHLFVFCFMESFFVRSSQWF